MAYRVAVAAQGSRMVTQHFGRATVFHVFERLGGEWTLIESREADPTCGPLGEGAEQHDSLLAYAADLVSDCDAVVAARVGPGAVRALTDRGVEVYAMHALIEDALSALAEELERLEAEQPPEGLSADTTTATTGEPVAGRQE